LKDTKANLDDLLDGTKLGEFKSQFTDLFGKGSSLLRTFGSTASKVVGGFVAGLVAVGVAMFEVYKANQQLNKELKQLKQLFKNVDTTTLIDAKNRIKSLADETEEDTKTITLAVNNLAKAYGISLPEAVKFYEEAVVRGANANGELADSVEEFSIQAKEAGLSVQQFQNLLVNSPAEGDYKDKLADLVKEINVVGSDFNKIKNDLTGVFDSTFINEQIEGLKTGNITAIQFYTNVNEKARELGKTTEEITALNRALYGALAEDAGKNAYKVISDSAKGVNETLTEQQKIVLEQKKAYDDLASSVDNFVAKFRGLNVIVDKILAKSTSAGAKIVDGFSGLADVFLSAFESDAERIAKINKEIEKDLEEIRKKQQAANTSTSVGLTPEQKQQLNAFRQASKEIALVISQDIFEAKLKELDDLKSLDETRLEDLKK
jgi:hypothetical protein